MASVLQKRSRFAITDEERDGAVASSPNSPINNDGVKESTTLAVPSIAAPSQFDVAHPKSERIGAYAVGLLSFLVYFLTLHPSVPGGDSGELITVANDLGVAHPPGYPLFTVLAKICIILLSPFEKIDEQGNVIRGSVAWRVNLMNAILATATCVLLFLSVCRLTRRNIYAAFAAAFMYGFSPLVWTYSVTAEVFSMNNFFAALLVYEVIQYYFADTVAKKNRLAYIGAFTCGFALTNQHTIVLYVLPFIVWILFVSTRTSNPAATSLVNPMRRFWTLAALFFLGMSPYLYMPLAHRYIRAVNTWGATDSIQGFLRHILRSEYGTFSLAPDDSGYKGDFWVNLRHYVRDIRTAQSGILGLASFFIVLAGVLLSSELFQRLIINNANKSPAAAAAAAAATDASNNNKTTKGSGKNKNKKGSKGSNGYRVVDILVGFFCSIDFCLVGSFLFYVIFFSSRANFPLEDNPLLFGVTARFWQQPNLLVFLYLGVGIDRLYRLVVSKISSSGGSNKATAIARHLLICFCALLAASQVAMSFSTRNESHNYTVRDWGKAILNSVPEGAIVMTIGDIHINSARYVQSGEHFRRDVRLMDQEMLTFPWYTPVLRHNYPDVEFPLGGTQYHVDGRPGSYTMRQFLDLNFPKRPNGIFMCTTFKSGDETPLSKYTLVPWGAVEKVVLKDKLYDIDLVQYLQDTKDLVPSPDNFTLYYNPEDKTSWEYIVVNDYWETRLKRLYFALTKALALHRQKTEGKRTAPFEESPMSRSIERVIPILTQEFEELIASRKRYDGTGRVPPHYYKNAGIAWQMVLQLPEHARNTTAVQNAIDAFSEYVRLAEMEDPTQLTKSTKKNMAEDTNGVRASIKQLQQYLAHIQR